LESFCLFQGIKIPSLDILSKADLEQVVVAVIGDVTRHRGQASQLCSS
jgi:hypothetical protein